MPEASSFIWQGIFFYGNPHICDLVWFGLKYFIEYFIKEIGHKFSNLFRPLPIHILYVTAKIYFNLYLFICEYVTKWDGVGGGINSCSNFTLARYFWGCYQNVIHFPEM